MKTLILNGSPRKEGDTASLLSVFKATLLGEVLQIDAFEANISPCTDCRACSNHSGCCKQDEMQEFYRKLEEYDNIIIASPIWMETLPPPLMSIASRLQPYFYRPYTGKPKKGGILLVGGGSGGAEKAESTARLILKQLNVKEIHPLILSNKTDSVPTKDDQASLRSVCALAEWMNKNN
ncbi:MAG: flavodoxin family protein [Clostridia bacterium]|nr:flavodoxin family protein [Clostridia bacterium]